jgi:hypothetical protein
MKEKIKRISSSTWALILAIMMVVSSFSVLAATTNVNKTRGSECFTANQTLYVDIGDTWENLFKDNTSVPYVTFSYSTENNDLSKPISRVPINESDKVNGSIYKITVPDNKYCRAIRFERTKYGDPSTIWNSVLTTSAVRSSDDQNLFTIYDYDKNKGWSIYNGGSTTTDLYLCGYINNSDVGHGDNRYKLTQSNDKYSGTFEFDSTSNTQYVTISNGSKAYVSGAENAVSGTKAGSTSPTSESPNPNFKWMVDTSTSKTITFTWDDTNKTLSWVTGSVEPTETTPTVTTPVSGDNYFLYNDNGGKSFKTSTSLGEFSSNVLSLDLDGGKSYYLYVVKGNNESKSYFNKAKAFDDSNKSVTLYDYGTNNFSDEIVFKPETSGKYKFTWTPKGTSEGTLKYELESTPVAKSVNLTANPENVVVGGSTTLTATLDTPNTDNVTYTFTEDSKELQNGSSNTLKLENLTEGTHTYKVTVSADGYTSVTATVEVNVNQTYNVTAKYKITEDGITYTDKDSNKDIVTVDGAESSTTSSGTVVAKDTITIGSSTYVFAGWESANGSFTDATKSSTTFSPSADADVYAQYKKQYTVSASTPGGNGTINVEKTTYLAGDTVTINIKPNSGYQLKSLKRTTGISGETTDVKAGVSNNKYVVDKISSDETFVAEFEKIPLDYSKYRVVGHFDDNKSWNFDDGCKFDTTGKATFTIANPTAVDGNGQFRIAWSDGSTTIQYGCGQNDLKKVNDGEMGLCQ